MTYVYPLVLQKKLEEHPSLLCGWVLSLLRTEQRYDLSHSSLLLTSRPTRLTRFFPHIYTQSVVASNNYYDPTTHSPTHVSRSNILLLLDSAPAIIPHVAIQSGQVSHQITSHACVHVAPCTTIRITKHNKPLSLFLSLPTYERIKS